MQGVFLGWKLQFLRNFGILISHTNYIFVKRKNLSYIALVQRATTEDGFILPLIILLTRNMVGQMGLRSEIIISKIDIPI